MIDFLLGTLKLIANVMVTGGLILGVVALAFAPLIDGKRRR